MINAAVGAALVLVGIALIPAWRPIDSGLNAPTGLLGQAPSAVTRALRAIATPEDRVWNPQVWGSWLEFAVPAPLYAFDARIEIMPPEAWANGDLVARAQPGWPEVLDAEGATIVVTEGPGTTPLAQALAASAGWKATHVDAEGSVWIRADR